MSERNEKIITTLRKMRSVDLRDPVARNYLIRKLSTPLNRDNVRRAVAAYASANEDKVINSRKEREMLAILITRQGNRSRARVPLTRAVLGATTSLRKRRYNFQESKGKGVRRFDGWNGYRIADANTKSDAERLARFVRDYRRKSGLQGKWKARVVPYQAGNKTHYSVYAERPMEIATKSHIDGLKRYRKDPEVRRVLERADIQNYKSKYGGSPRVRGPNNPILITKKRLPELGLRVRTW